MGKSSDTPTQPSAQEQAAAQLALNQGTSLWNAQLGSPNVVNPFGSSTWTMGAPMAGTTMPGGMVVGGAADIPSGMSLPGFTSGSSSYYGGGTGTGTTSSTGGLKNTYNFNDAQAQYIRDVTRNGRAVTGLNTVLQGDYLQQYNALAPEQKAAVQALGTDYTGSGSGTSGLFGGGYSGLGGTLGGLGSSYGGYDLPPQFTNTQTWGDEGMALFNQVFGNTTMPDNATLAAQAQGLSDATYEAGVARMAPQIQAEEAAFENAMATRGIPVGSELYNQQRALLDKSRQESYQQLALASMQAGREEQNRLFNLDLAQRNYQSGLLGMYAQNVPNSTYGATASSAPDIAGYMQNQYANQLASANAANASNSSLLGTLGTLGSAYMLSPTTAATAAGTTAAGTAAAGGLGTAIAAGAPWLLGGLLLSSLFD